MGRSPIQSLTTQTATGGGGGIHEGIRYIHVKRWTPAKKQAPLMFVGCKPTGIKLLSKNYSTFGHREIAGLTLMIVLVHAAETACDSNAKIFVCVDHLSYIYNYSWDRSMINFFSWIPTIKHYTFLH